MSDLISRHAAIDCVNHVRFGMEKMAFDIATTALLELPSAQPERKKGRWILYENQRQEDVDNDNYLYICSECGKSDLHAKTQKVPFCWNCGSRMDGEENG